MYQQATHIKYFAVFFIVILGVFAVYLYVRHNASPQDAPVKTYILPESTKNESVEKSKNTSVFAADETTEPSETNATVDTKKSIIKKDNVVKSAKSSEKSAAVVTDPNAPATDETQNDNETHALSIQEKIDALKSQGLIPEGATVEVGPMKTGFTDPEALARSKMQEITNNASVKQVSRETALAIADKLKSNSDPKQQELANHIRTMVNNMPEGGILMLNTDILPDNF